MINENANGRYEAQVFYIDARGQNVLFEKLFLTILMDRRFQYLPILSISKNENNGTFTIIAKNLKGLEGYKEVKIPFWSHANGMSDIKWYTPTRQADGSYTVTVKASDHGRMLMADMKRKYFTLMLEVKTLCSKSFCRTNDPSKPTGVIYYK